ncbi:DUF2326 domain-containing protein [Isoptericola sp. NPDC019693]|uniref:DUF2326 domain-containing protein n=1 Tax=Isoptericola sp. NPDC019693 TaxID=3364009 RepID=UPI0037B39DE8
MKLAALSANFSEFHPILFNDDLSVILAERSQGAADTESRNGLGKTTAVALVDFCLGSNMGEHLRQMMGRDWTFKLDLVLPGGAEISASRSPDLPRDVVISGDLARARVPDFDPSRGADHVVLGVRRWTSWLGEVTFYRGRGSEQGPSFRSLVKHFIRFRSDSFIDPFRPVANQAAADVQLENAFLLDLDWSLVNEWVSLKERRNRLALARSGDLDVSAQIADLEAQCVRLDRRSERLQRNAAGFEILPEFREIENRVNSVSRALKVLSNANVADRQLLQMYENQVNEERSNHEGWIAELFDQASVHLGDAVVRSLEEASAFRLEVERNREAYLQAEIRRIRERTRARELEQDQLAARHAEDLRLLDSGGALEDFSELQKSIAEAVTQLAEARANLATLRDLSEREAQVKRDELDVAARTELDLQERFSRREPIIARFGEIMEALLGESADIRVRRGKSGFMFDTKLPRTGSSGVNLMAIFAYDIALTETLQDEGHGLGFLIHDSLIFADVDERQTAIAIDIAQRSAVDHGYQYVLTVNSDKVPWHEFGDQEAFRRSIVLTLDDGSPSGSLLGLRLDASE